MALVDAETSGNVGTVARAMKNFGLEELVLVDPPAYGPGTEAAGFAGRARTDVLTSATELTFDALVERYHTIAFTALANAGDTKHVRYPVTTPAQLADRLAGIDQSVALVFGRERIGLTNDELAQMDELCTIPANPAYPVLNLGQAATIALYELRDLTLGETQLPTDPHVCATPREVEALYAHFDRLLDTIDFPPERREKTEVMFRRVHGRTDLTPREVSTLHGIFQRVEYVLDTA